MQLLPGGGRGDVCVHWGLRAPLSTSSSALSERRALRARRRLFSAQMKKKMIACVASDPVNAAAMACDAASAPSMYGISSEKMLTMSIVKVPNAR